MSQQITIDANMLREFGQFLVDTLLNKFRDLCCTVSLQKPTELAKLRAFFAALGDEFEIAVVTLNYDDLVYRSVPGLETGFYRHGRFVDERITKRRVWPCILHMHGSVHFDMRDDDTDSYSRDVIHRQYGQFHQNAKGKANFKTIEGTDFPTSSIIAGYGKTMQILRRPFRTYFAEVDQLVAGCDAALFLGYGFSDIHLNFAFEKFRSHRRRPVVIVDFADDKAMTANLLERNNDSHKTVIGAMGIFKTNSCSMSCSSDHITPVTVSGLKIAQEFEISNAPERPLAIWYGGMLAACDNINKVLSRLH